MGKSSADMNTDRLLVADLFCGAGGTTTGAMNSARELGFALDVVAVNHWDVAIATHRANHPRARHAIQDLDSADPDALVPEGRLDLLMASPECRFFSRARAGKPMTDQNRMSPWMIQRWLCALDVKCLLIENVQEFVHWGPVDPQTRRPDKSRRGMYFEEWVRSLWGLGYTVDWKLLNAADYGEATSRVRFFLQARRDGKPIEWPEPTHINAPQPELESLSPWRGAREIIEWSDIGRSILDDPKYKKRPLSVRTRLRIAKGLYRFGGKLAEYYINLLNLPDELAAKIASESQTRAGHGEAFRNMNRQHNGARGMDEPIIELQGSAFHGSNRQNSAPRDMDAPLPTITTWGNGGCYMVEPLAFVLSQQSAGAPRPVGKPVPTIASAGAIALIKPILSEYYGNGQSRSVDAPLSTVTTRERHGLTMPCAYIVPNFGERGDQSPRTHCLDNPLPTVTSAGAGNLVMPSIELAQGIAIEDMNPNRFIQIGDAIYLLDIRYRMLRNDELARAMGFIDEEQDYVFAGTKRDITKQIGNAVPVKVAQALVGSILRSFKEGD